MKTPCKLSGLCLQLCTLLYIHGTQGTSLLDSLTCVHNISEHWTCRWTESAELQRRLPISLHYWSNVDRSPRRCTPECSETPDDGQCHKTCHFTEVFSSMIDSNFSFVPDRSLHAVTSFIPATKVKIPPPDHLTVLMSSNGSVIVTWEMPEYVHLYVTVCYQITYYRKYWETQEDAVSLNVLGNTEVELSPQLFVPGSTYVFRVRAAAQEDPSHRSAWSTELAWVTPEDNRAILQNVNCEYDGWAELRCSWEVRIELMDAVPFVLYYNDSTDDVGNISSNAIQSLNGEKLCYGEVQEIKEGARYAQYGCTFQISSSQKHQSLDIQIRPREEVKHLKPNENIQTGPPTDLKVEDRLDRGYILKWSQPVVTLTTLQFTYQLCFWKQAEPECPSHSLVNVSGNLLQYYFPVSTLEGSSNYTVKVRAKPDKTPAYNAQWSSWSQSYSWKTHPVLAAEPIYLSISIPTCLVLSLLIVLGFWYGWRLYRKMEDNLPQAKKSKLLSSLSTGFWRLNVYPLLLQNNYEEEQPSICVLIGPIDTPDATPEPAEEAVTEEAQKNATDCPLGPYSLFPAMEEKRKPLQFSYESPGTTEVGDIQTVPVSELTRSPPDKCYTGPYLMFARAQSMLDLVSKEPTGAGYFSLPRCQTELLNPPKEKSPTSRGVPSEDHMAYVAGMDKQFPVQKNQNSKKERTPDNSQYFAIPSPAEFQVSPEVPLMIMNPDGSGSLMLKQVGDYCFFPGLRESQEHLESKMAPSTEQKQQDVLPNPPLPAVQAFKVMQGGYFALPQM
ncbi:cytokine receptor common subunit beta [Hyperolius riggenbachi]|uniref:cytokine receptor common subunit beta n=1 Tax=Hyperolius riggenbachi TaxID=752182 RepID=UPI0035A33409